jgi:molybdopterin converting factor small subunit
MKLNIHIPRILRKEHESSVLSVELNREMPIIKLLQEVLGERFSLVFNENGMAKGFVRIFHNDNYIDNILNVAFADGDDLEIITSMSGG